MDLATIARPIAETSDVLHQTVDVSSLIRKTLRDISELSTPTAKDGYAALRTVHVRMGSLSRDLTTFEDIWQLSILIYDSYETSTHMLLINMLTLSNVCSTDAHIIS